MPKGEKTVRVRNVKINSSLPEGEYQELHAVIESTRRWNDVADFARQAIREKLDRWKAAGHRLPEGPGPADLVEEVRRERRRAP